MSRAKNCDVSFKNPDLTISQIVQFFQENGVELKPEDIKTPTPETLRDAMSFLVALSPPPQTDFKDAPFRAVEQLSYPELYEQGITDMETCQRLLDLLSKIGVPHISIRHLFFPDVAATKQILSAAVNFSLFQAEHNKVYAEFHARTTELMEVRSSVDADLASLLPELERLRAAYAKVMPVVKAREAEAEEWKGTVSRLGEEHKVLAKEVKALKEEIQAVNARTANEHFLVMNAKREIELLRKQVLKSPEKLRGRLAKMEHDIKTMAEEAADVGGRLSEMQTQGLTMSRVSNKLAKRIATLKNCEEDKKKGRELHQELKHRVQDIQSEEEKIQELQGTSQHWDKQLLCVQEKLASLKRQGEEKRAKAQQALDETERQRMQLEYSIRQDQDQVKQNKVIIHRKEQEVQRSNEEHSTELYALREHYWRLAQSLRAYHADIAQSTFERRCYPS